MTMVTDYLLVIDLLDEEPEQEESRLDCAWCLAEMDIVPTEGSHGICTDHADALISAHRTRRARG